jgi:hypothetical protein
MLRDWFCTENNSCTVKPKFKVSIKGIEKAVCTLTQERP